MTWRVMLNKALFSHNLIEARLLILEKHQQTLCRKFLIWHIETGRETQFSRRLISSWWISVTFLIIQNQRSKPKRLSICWANPSLQRTFRMKRLRRQLMQWCQENSKRVRCLSDTVTLEMSSSFLQRDQSKYLSTIKTCHLLTLNWTRK